jgi:hypothetical protein
VLRDAQRILLVLGLTATRKQDAECRPRHRELREPGDNRRIDATSRSAEAMRPL